MRVLFLGQHWYGSNSYGWCCALNRKGVELIQLDEDTFIPHAFSTSGRILRRLLTSVYVSEYNREIVKTAHHFRPEAMLALKGNWITVATLRELRRLGISLYNFYTDTSAFAHRSLFPESLQEYDCVFYTKPFWLGDVSGRLRLRDAEFLSHGYDPDLHHPIELEPEDIKRYGYDVTVIATYTPHKEMVLSELVRLRPSLDLCIWGDRWTRKCHNPNLRKFIAGSPLPGQSYVKAILAAKINLAIMSGVVPGASQGDETTARTLQIPAIGAFMLHERSNELLCMYEDGVEVASFGNTEEMAAAIDYFLAEPDRRHQIAKAGHRRCVPAYSVDNRLEHILNYHSRRQNSKEVTAGILDTVLGG